MGSFKDRSVESIRRVRLPARFRRVIEHASGSRECVLTVSPEGCLTGCAASTWPHLVDCIQEAITEFDPTLLAFFHRFAAMANLVKPDRQGRFSLPPHLMQFAGIGRRVHFIGCGHFFEIWDPQRFDESLASSLATADLTSVRGFLRVTMPPE